MSKDKGQGWLTVLGLSAVFGVYSIATQESAAETSKANSAASTEGPRAVSTTVPEARSDDLPPTYRGYACTQDCSGHEAGYDWAEEQGITDADDCDGNSDSFVEGCQAYAEEADEDSSEDDAY